MSTLQCIKDKRLTAAQEREHRTVFELATEGSNVMTVKQLKLCLRAMGFNVAKGEAQSLVYEFDYTDSNSIDLADFQKICLAKSLEISDRDRFEQAFRLHKFLYDSALSIETKSGCSCICRSVASDFSAKVSLHQLSLSLHATEFLDHDAIEDIPPCVEEIDSNVLRHQLALQYYTEEDIDAVMEFRHSEIDLRISKAALAAFIRV